MLIVVFCWDKCRGKAFIWALGKGCGLRKEEKKENLLQAKVIIETKYRVEKDLVIRESDFVKHRHGE